MAVQKTLSITEAFNERIKVYEEDLTSCRVALSKAAAKNTLVVFSKIVGSILSVIGVIFIIGSFASIGSGDDASTLLFIIGALSLLFGSLLLWIKGVNTKLLKLEIDSLKDKVAKVKQERRDSLLKCERENHEYEISEVVTENFEEQIELESTREKECPMCAELVKVNAKICRFCRHEFSC